MEEQQIQIEDVLTSMREQIGLLYQENAVLKATIKSMKNEEPAANS